MYVQEVKIRERSANFNDGLKQFKMYRRFRKKNINPRKRHTFT